MIAVLEFAAWGGDRYPHDLRDALRGLDKAEDEARQEGCPALSDTALRNAQRLLCAMYGISPRRTYPTPHGEIATDAPKGFGRSVLLPCDPDGGAW